jgi:probable phosphomutase (TIGR03848 family)
MATKVARSDKRKAAPAGTLLLLVRHAQTPSTGKVLPGRAKGLHLSEDGRAEADAAAERIAGFGDRVAAVYASPLERTRETAAPIAAALGQKVVIERGLLEADFGDWTGAELKALAKQPEWKAVQLRPSRFRFPGGESFAEMQLRICAAIDRLVLAHPGKVVVAVSHADPIKAYVAQTMGCHLDLFQRIVVSPCSVTAVAHGGDGASAMVLCVNSTGRDLTSLAPS